MTTDQPHHEALRPEQPDNPDRLAAGSTTWLNIRSEIMSRITNQHYAAGGLIPTEEALAREFGCARATVNRALTSLAARGVLERRRRIGTRVAPEMSRGSARVTLPVLRHILEGRGHVYRFDYRGTTGRAPSAEISDRLFMSRVDDLQEHITRHYSDDRLLCLERRWTDASMLPELTEAVLKTVSLNEWMAHHASLTQLETSISAQRAADVEADRLLGCAPDVPVLVYEVCHWIGPRPLGYSRFAFRPGFTLEMAAA